ncbi:transposase [Streptomyces coelicoflavus]|uniref:Transposase n=1 Tax=Streptomyces coelicoflavus TaxID=285562 RepID=A0A6N9UEK8_9ACTN|nr:transposase [Streptomyces coelicoflavus]
MPWRDPDFAAPGTEVPSADPSHHWGEARRAGHRRHRGSAGCRPPGFDREKYKARHKVECRIGLVKQARGVATRYEKLAVRHEAAIQLTLIRQAL